MRALVALGVAVATVAAGDVGCRGSALTGLPRHLDVLAAAEIPAGRSGGVVLVARGGEPLLRRAYGMADVELGVAMRPDHVLGVGSITKQFTAAAILRLVADGRVSLDDDVRHFIADAPTHGRQITIEQLLTHTSGLANCVDRDDFASLARLDHAVEELVGLTRDIPLRFEPGSDFYYSDSGYFVLGVVIERVSGSSYARYLEEKVFAPLGMADTRVADGVRLIPRRATGYSIRQGRFTLPDPISMSVPYAAGAVFSNVDDLLRWHLALRAGRAIPLELLELAWRPRTLPDGRTTGYGFGWQLCALAGHGTVEHGGFVNGYLASAIQVPDEKLDVIVLVNNDGDAPDAGLLARRLARLVLTGSPEPTFVELTVAQRAALVGRYEIAPGDVREVFERDGALYSQRRDGAIHRLAALSPTELTLAGDDGAYLLNFEFATDGRAAGVSTSVRCEPGDFAARLEELR